MHVVIGCNGPVGRTLMQHLAEAGTPVRGVCRSAMHDAPEGTAVVPGDARDAEDVARLTRDAEVAYACIGLPYPAWQSQWPPIIDALVEGLSRSGASLVFVDNLYCYGPQRKPLTEDMDYTGFGSKPALRARVARRLLEAHDAGRFRVALVRASDFYGPLVRNAVLGERVFPNLLQRRPAQLIGNIDQPHSFTFVPDLVRAVTNLAADERAWGEAWHVPNAPALTPRQVVTEAGRLAGQEVKIRSLPFWMITALSPFSPLMRELREMKFQWDRPYVVGHMKYVRTFGDHSTPLADGLRATLDWYAARPPAGG